MTSTLQGVTCKPPFKSFPSTDNNPPSLTHFLSPPTHQMGPLTNTGSSTNAGGTARVTRSAISPGGSWRTGGKETEEDGSTGGTERGTTTLGRGPSGPQRGTKRRGVFVFSFDCSSMSWDRDWPGQRSGMMHHDPFPTDLAVTSPTMSSLICVARCWVGILKTVWTLMVRPLLQSYRFSSPCCSWWDGHRSGIV